MFNVVCLCLTQHHKKPQQTGAEMVRQDERSNVLQVLIVAVVALPHPRMKQMRLQKKATCSFLNLHSTHLQFKVSHHFAGSKLVKLGLENLCKYHY